MTDNTFITPAVTDFLSHLPEAAIILFTAPETHSWGGQFRRWCLYRKEKRNGEIVVDWLVETEFQSARAGVDNSGFVQDTAWETTPPTTRFIRGTP